MSLRPQEPPMVPEETHRVAQAAFPKGTLCLRIADALGPVYQDRQFAALFPRRGQPAAPPGRLALAVVLQFVEGTTHYGGKPGPMDGRFWPLTPGGPSPELPGTVVSGS